MKQIIATYQAKTLNFRHWNRKGYAAFVSLDKVVRIAVLKLTVSDRLSIKLGMARCISLLEEFNYNISDADEEEEIKYSILSYMLDEMLCVVSKPAVTAGSVVDYIIKLKDISPASVR